MMTIILLGTQLSYHIVCVLFMRHLGIQKDIDLFILDLLVHNLLNLISLFLESQVLLLLEEFSLRLWNMSLESLLFLSKLNRSELISQVVCIILMVKSNEFIGLFILLLLVNLVPVFGSLILQSCSSSILEIIAPHLAFTISFRLRERRYISDILRVDEL
jgi:hypothetical protein